MMPREFIPFDEERIDEELAELERASITDAAKLDFCIRRYEQLSGKENPSPALVKSFENGFLELRHIKGEYKGRLLFYIPKFPRGTQELVMLVVFRKQSQKTPASTIELASRRMALDLEKRRNKEISK